MEEKRFKPNHDIRTNPENNLRNYYTVFFEIGIILALLIMTVLFRIHFQTSETELPVFHEQEAIQMEEIVQTEQRLRVPPPPRPPVPVAVPNDEIIEDVNIDINAELDFDVKLDLPPAPPQQAAEAEEPEEVEEFFVIVEQMPELIGGIASLQQLVVYPELAVRAGIQGRVYVQFIVNENGEVEDPRIVRGIGGGCDEEALRIVKMAKFRPGLQRGRPVRVQYNLPVIFKLSS